MKLFVLHILISALLLTCSQVTLADELFRCGNSFQDTPCRNSATRKPANETTTPIVENNVANAMPPALTISADCKVRGEAAKEIVKLRDAGNTEEQQLKDVYDEDSIALIKNVYSRRGSSWQVQYALEHECMQLKEKDRLTKKLTTDSNKLRNSSLVTSKNKPSKPTKPIIERPAQPENLVQAEKPVPLVQATHQVEPVKQLVPMKQVQLTQPQAAAPAPIAQKIQADEKPHEQGDELGICSSFKAGLDNIASQMRKGGDAALMKDLKQQKIQLKQEIKSAGCQT